MNPQSLLANWPFEPTIIIGVALAAALYARGVYYSMRAGIGRRLRWWHSVCFGLGLLTTFIALDSPLDGLADHWLWAHMIQHELLILVAAPLLLFGQPIWPLWRSLPLPTRRASLRWTLQRRWPRRVWHRVKPFIFAPVPAWLLFSIVFTVWHIAPLYDYALENTQIHILEHIMFLGTALLLWAQVIPSRPMQPSMSYLQQGLFVLAFGMFSNVIGSLFVFSTAPFYPYYIALPRPASAISALVDQHLAGAAMDVPGTIILFVFISGLLWLWLGEDERGGPNERKRFTAADAPIDPTPPPSTARDPEPREEVIAPLYD